MRKPRVLLIFGLLGLGLLARHSFPTRSSWVGHTLAAAQTAPEGEAGRTREAGEDGQEGKTGDGEAQAERREIFFKVINFAILAGALVFFLRKPLREFFVQRSGSIQKSLEEGRKALEASQIALSAVEEKLRRMEGEIRAFKASAVREIYAERERIRQQTREEAQKMLESSRALIETSTRAARLELKTYAVQQAIELAEQMIRQQLDDARRRQLVHQFVEGVMN